jgi:hypothetical protein
VVRESRRRTGERRSAPPGATHEQWAAGARSSTLPLASPMAAQTLSPRPHRTRPITLQHEEEIAARPPAASDTGHGCRTR